jgi:hypothetical protein
MHRPPKLPAAAAAGLALFLAACAGETPTSPKPASTPASGPCTSAIALPAGPITTYAGTAISLRAQVTNGGVAVADNTSVSFTMDLGFFNENGLPTISKTTRDGVADVSPGSLVSGTATVRAAYACASASVQIVFQVPPDSGPYISLIQPESGSAAGGDTVVISGGRFGTNAAAISSVTFGGAPTAALGVSDSSISVKTPPRALASASVPETVDVCVRYFSGVASVCKTKAFTYYAINPNQKMGVSSLSPSSGAPAGGDSVSILGTNFGSSVATTRVTFCGLSAAILQMTDSVLQVTTPRKVLANPAVSEACDVVVTIDLGKVSAQSAVLVQSFTYRGSGGSATCGTDPSLFVSSLSPNTGPPDGGTTVNLVGGGFPTTPAGVRVEFGGTAAQVLITGANAISVVSPRHTLADSLIPEAVDVVVTDLGSATGRCARFTSGFTYTQQALTPTIYNISPSGGPNDSSIAVTISGDGFQSPEKVFLTGGNCGSLLVEATVSTVSRTQIVFMSPLASGAGSTPCLAGSQMDVRVTNTTTGKSATCPQCFRYGCLSVSGVAPSILPTGTQTAVTISGANFQSPMQATFQAGGVTDYPLTVSSVTSSAVVVQMPPLSTIAPNQPACTPLIGNIVLKSTSLSCNPVQASVTYRPDTPTLASVAPTTLSQDGSPSGAYGTAAATITLSGSGFADPMTVVLIKDGVPVQTTIGAVRVLNATTLQFTAPAVPDSSLNSGTCSSTPGGPLDGTQNVPTQFGVRVTNKTSGCSSDMPAVLVYNPRAQLAACSPSPLDPVIYSLSPNTGPNDTQTLVSMAGINFQNPPKIYVTGGPCGGQLIEASVVGTATPTQVTFKTPLATGPGSYPCLSGAQVDIQILNPSGRRNTLAGGFKYYSCASVTGVQPAVIPTGTTTNVQISGANFPSNVQATFQAGGVATFPLTVASVSPSLVVVQMPPLATLAPNLANCQSLTGAIVLSSPSLLCNPVQTSISYHPDSLTLTSASPGTLNQDGSAPAAPGTPALVTVNGSGFAGGHPMTVTILDKNSNSVATVQATVTGTGTLTFTAPAVPDTSFNQNQCSTSGGTVDGTQYVATGFTIRVKDNTTNCTSDLPGALLYYPKASLALCVATPLTPTINSISPTTGPNDAPTRVSIFGTNFQFPEQVFLTGGACGSQKIEVPVVAPVTLNQIVFQTPVAAGAYACLAGAQVDVQVLNPTTGKTANCAGCFKFYSCPTATTATPSVIPTNGATVTISGNNFQQPVEATFTPSGLPAYRLTVTSVSSTSIILQMPPYASVLPGSASCSPLAGSINIYSTGLSCQAATVPVTYRPDAPTLLSAYPTTLPQDGGGTTITVNGTGFVMSDLLNVTLIKDGSAIGGTTVVATVTADGVLTFTAPAVPDLSMNRDNCATIPAGPINGTQAVPTRFGIRVTNQKSGCSGDLQGVLIYNPRPAIALCAATLQITTASLPSATLCSAYGNPMTASGGTTPYVWSLSGAPAWLAINPATGTLLGTPNILAPANTGGAYVTSFSVNVADSGSPPASTGRSYSLVVNDPDGPFSISGPSSVTIPPGPGSIPLAVLPASGFSPYNWAFVGAPPAGFTLSSTTGASISVIVAGVVPVGPYSISVQATDSPSCAGATHSFTLPISVTRN